MSWKVPRQEGAWSLKFRAKDEQFASSLIILRAFCQERSVCSWPVAPLRCAGSRKQAAFSPKGTHKPLKILGSCGVGVGAGVMGQIYIFKILL